MSLIFNTNSFPKNYGQQLSRIEVLCLRKYVNLLGRPDTASVRCYLNTFGTFRTSISSRNKRAYMCSLFVVKQAKSRLNDLDFMSLFRGESVMLAGEFTANINNGMIRTAHRFLDQLVGEIAARLLWLERTLRNLKDIPSKGKSYNRFWATIEARATQIDQMIARWADRDIEVAINEMERRD